MSVMTEIAGIKGDIREAVRRFGALYDCHCLARDLPSKTIPRADAPYEDGKSLLVSSTRRSCNN